METAFDTIVQRLRAARVVPVATIEDPSDAARVGSALVSGGVACLEVAFRHPQAEAAIREARTVDGLLVGAGTLLEPDQTRAAAAAGAQFAVAPGLSPELVALCRKLDLPFFPGVATPSEIDQARRLGCSLVKVFPIAQLGGAAFLRAVAPISPGMSFLPTGGVTAESLADYLTIPTVVACGGSWLVPPELIRARRFDEIEALARAVCDGRS